MQLSLKQLLTLTVLFGSTAYATVSPSNPQDTLLTDLKSAKKSLDEYSTSEKKGTLKPSVEQMILVLKHPKCLVDKNFVIEDVTEKECKDENPREFYRFHFEEEKNLEAFGDYIKNVKNTNLDNLSDASLKNSVLSQFEIKKKYLETILSGIPIVQDAKAYGPIVQSHIDNFVSESLLYDGKRLTFSNLLKNVESILNAYEVNRKASDAVQAAIAMLENKDTPLEKLSAKQGFNIKRDPTDAEKKAQEEQKQKDKEAGIKEKKKPENILKVALKASDKSTSSPANLAYVLLGSIAIATCLLAYKFFTSKPAKDDDEE